MARTSDFAVKRRSKGGAKARKQEGGLATSIHTDPVARQRDIDFLNTRNQHMREVAGKPAYAKGGRPKSAEGRRKSLAIKTQDR